jgi:phage regulator Rha-like protein
MATATKRKTATNADEQIISRIYYVRDEKVMLDYDLAELYEVETKVFNQAVKRNSSRFPEDFMFRLTQKEWNMMRSQIVTASSQIIKRNTSITPFAFTEHGVTMLASVLKSERAIKMSIAVVRAFIELKRSASQFKELSEQLELIKQHLGEHDAQLNGIYEAIENLLDDKGEKQLTKDRKRIGFRPDE